MNKTNRLMIATLASLFSLVMVAPTAAQVATDGNMPDWQSMSPTELLWAAKNLAGDDPALVAARKAVAEQVGSRIMADATSTRSVALPQWADLSKALSADLTAEQKTQWITRLRAAYVQDATGLAGLKTSIELGDLIGTLGLLGQKADDLNGVAAAFVLANTGWQSWRASQVADLAGKVSRLGDAGASARQALIGSIESKYLSAANAGKLTLSEWKSFTGSLGSGLSKEAKAQWSAILTQAFAGGESANALSANGAKELTGVLGNLGAKAQAVDTMANLAAASTGWQTWDLNTRIWLIGVLTAPDKRESTKPARLKILEHITATCMPTAEEAKKVPLDQWGSLVMGLYDVMPEEISSLWAERLKGIFSSEALAGLVTDVKQRRALLPVIAILDEKMKTGLALSWLKDRTLWQGAPIEALAALALAAYRDNRDETLPILGDLDKYCVARHATKPLTLDECLALRGMHLAAGQLPKAQQWVLVGCDVAIGTEALRAAANQSTVYKLSPALVDTGLSGPSKDCSRLAATVAALVAKGGLEFRRVGQSKCVGEAMGTPAGRQIVRDALLDAQGSPRLEAAKILACSYRTYGDFKAWRDYVGQQVSGASDGDRKALWLMVKGYTDAVVPDSPNLLRVAAGATAALSQASTDAVRILAIRELANVYERLDRPGVAVKIIESMKGQFAGDSLATIESMQHELSKKETERLSVEAKRKAALAAAQKKAMLDHYRERLAEAQAAGDAAKAARITAAIEKLKTD